MNPISITQSHHKCSQTARNFLFIYYNLCLFYLFSGIFPISFLSFLPNRVPWWNCWWLSAGLSSGCADITLTQVFSFNLLTSLCYSFNLCISYCTTTTIQSIDLKKKFFSLVVQRLSIFILIFFFFFCNSFMIFFNMILVLVTRFCRRSPKLLLRRATNETDDDGILDRYSNGNSLSTTNSTFLLKLTNDFIKVEFINSKLFLFM